MYLASTHQIHYQGRPYAEPERLQSGSDAGKLAAVPPGGRDLVIDPLLPLIPWPARDTVFPNETHRIQTAHQYRERDIGRRQFRRVLERRDMRPANRDGDCFQQLASSHVLVSIPGRREIVMVGQKKSVTAVRPNRMVYLAIPEGIVYFAVAIVVSLRSNRLDTPNPDDETRDAFSKRLTFFAIEEDKRSIGRELSKKS
jgi:hypothetical protein